MSIPVRNKLIILTAVMASLLEIIDTSIVNVAVPTMMGNLGATLDEISWVITGYIIANAIVLPISSWISGQFGRKIYYTSCIVLFTAASVACGLAPNLPMLVVFRVIQGLAGGALLPTSQALIYEAFPREQAGMASAIYGMSIMIGPTLGPTLGGYLTDHFGWRSIFNINLPVGIIVAFLSWSLVEDVGYDPAAAVSTEKKKLFKPKDQRKPIDTWGLLLLFVGIGCAQFVLERGHAEDWFESWLIIACTALAVVSIIGLIVWELRAPHPILQLKHFSNPTFRSGVILMSILGMMLYAIIFVIPIFVSDIHGLTATQTGELFIPGAFAAAMIMPFIGMQLRKRDPRIFIAMGFTLLGVAVFMMSGFDSDTSTGGMFWGLLFRGIAMAFLFVPINSTVLSQFSGASIGEAAGLLNLCRQLGGSIGIAVMATLFQHFQESIYADMRGHVTWFDTAGTAQYAGILAMFQAKMSALVGMGDHTIAAVKLLVFRAKKQAFVIAFQHTFKIALVVLAFSYIPTYFLRPKKGVPAGGVKPVDAH